MPKRLREFATVRLCARRAMRKLGVPPASLVPRARGDIEWPQPVVGSMTHCPGYRAALVGYRRDFVGIGIDAEPNLPLPDRLLGFVSLPEERAHVLDLCTSFPGTRWDRLLFCAKEAIFKAEYPIARREFGFHDADVRFGAEDGVFVARLTRPEGVPDQAFPIKVQGRWMCKRGFVVAVLCLEASNQGTAEVAAVDRD